jgi:hypothetical protein
MQDPTLGSKITLLQKDLEPMRVTLKFPTYLVRTPNNESIPRLPLAIIPVASVHQCCTIEGSELSASSLSFNIVMVLQFLLILTATALSLHDYFYPRS